MIHFGPYATINLGGVNCYLLKVPDGYILIDTGYSNRRTALEQKLNQAGCLPGNLKLIILTHGDSDHAGNGAYLCETFDTKIAMHAEDVGMVERGDMNWRRKSKPDKMSLIFKIISRVTPLFVKPGKFDVFKPDLTIDEDFDLSSYGLDARIVHLPGHSKGSIGILTANGDLYCGDFLYNFMGFDYVDDLNDFKDSMAKLNNLNLETLYPGHGKPFSWEKVQRKYRYI